MFVTNFRFVVGSAVLMIVVLVSVVSVGCGDTGNLAKPDPSPPPPNGNGEPPPPPPPPICEPLGTHHVLMGADEQFTMMWTELTDLAPPCGSKVKVGPQNCADPSAACFKATLRVGFEKKTDKPPVRAFIEFFWSDDGANPWGDGLRSLSITEGESESVDLGPWIMRFAPKYLLVRGGYPVQGSATKVQGITSIPLDYDKQ